MLPEDKRGKLALALMVAGIMLISGGLVAIAQTFTASNVDAQLFYEPYRVRRWNPPTYPGVMGPQIQIDHYSNSDVSTCSIGFFVYNVTSRTWYYEPFSYESDSIEPSFTQYTTRVWMVSAGHCGDENSLVYQPDMSSWEYEIGEVEYSTVFESPEYLLDALLVRVETRIAYNTVPQPQNVVNKVLVLKFTDTSTCEWVVYNATSVEPDRGNFTADSFYTAKWPIYHAGRTQGYTVTDVWDENGNRVYNSMLSPVIVQFAWYESAWNTWMKSLAFKVNLSGLVPCTGEEVPIAAPGDSGSVAIAYIGFGNDLTDPRENVVLGIFFAKYDPWNAVFVAPASKVIYRYNLIDNLDLKFYNGTVVP